MVSMTLEDSVRDFVKKELPLVTSLFLKKINIDDNAPLQDLHEADDIAEMARKYFEHFNVNPDGFSLSIYSPWEIKSLFSRNTVNKNKKPLTIEMFISSARAGRWLYH